MGWVTVPPSGTWFRTGQQSWTGWTVEAVCVCVWAEVVCGMELNILVKTLNSCATFYCLFVRNGNERCGEWLFHIVTDHCFPQLQTEAHGGQRTVNHFHCWRNVIEHICFGANIRYNIWFDWAHADFNFINPGHLQSRLTLVSESQWAHGCQVWENCAPGLSRRLANLPSNDWSWTTSLFQSWKEGQWKDTNRWWTLASNETLTCLSLKLSRFWKRWPVNSWRAAAPISVGAKWERSGSLERFSWVTFLWLQREKAHSSESVCLPGCYY